MTENEFGNATMYELTNKETGKVYPMIPGSGEFGQGTLSFRIEMGEDGNSDIQTVVFENPGDGTHFNEAWEMSEMARPEATEEGSAASNEATPSEGSEE